MRLRSGEARAGRLRTRWHTRAGGCTEEAPRAGTSTNVEARALVATARAGTVGASRRTMPFRLPRVRAPRSLQALWMIAMAATGSGCTSYFTHGSARTLGHLNYSVSASAKAFTLDVYEGPDVLPDAEVGVAMGIGDRVDLGLRVHFPGSQPTPMADVKVALIRSDSPTSGVDLALAGTASVEMNLVPYGQLALMTGFNLPHSHQLLVTPQVVFYAQPKVVAALSLGFIWRITPAFAIKPEVAIARVFEPSDSSRRACCDLQGGLGVLFTP